MVHLSKSSSVAYRVLGVALAMMLATPASADSPTDHASQPQSPKPAPPTMTAKPIPNSSTSMTTAEWIELKAAREAALKANPDLMRTSAELAARLRDFQQKLNDAMVQANPTVAPTIAKLEHNRAGLSAPPPTRPMTTNPNPAATANPPPNVPLPVNLNLPPNLANPSHPAPNP